LKLRKNQIKTEFCPRFFCAYLKNLKGQKPEFSNRLNKRNFEDFLSNKQKNK